MCRLVAAAVAAGDAAVEADARRVGRYSEGEAVAPSPEELAGRLLTTLYMGSANSTAATRDRCAARGCWVLCSACACVCVCVRVLSV